MIRLYQRFINNLKEQIHLIIGAFGCGVFGNDARIVSQLFHRALEEYEYFDIVVFAILCRPENDYNLKEFRKRFEK